MLSKFWLKIKGFFNWLGDGLGEAVPYLLTAIVVIAIIGAAIFIVQERKQKQELALIAQQEAQLNPSIGEPLAPDVNPEATNQAGSTTDQSQNQTGEVAGQETGSGSVTNQGSETSSESATNTEPAEEILYESPPTGINPDAPINYQNTELNFKITLPPRAVVKEQGQTVNFYSTTGDFLATVSVLTATSSLTELKSQLSLSPDVSALHETKFAGQPAIGYTQQQLRGYVLTSPDRIFYFTGQPNILSGVSL